MISCASSRSPCLFFYFFRGAGTLPGPKLRNNTDLDELRDKAADRKKATGEVDDSDESTSETED